MSAFWKDLFREIKSTPGRFLSLMVITALGAASIVGIQATSIDMRAIADKTYKTHNLYDIQIKSATGFDDDDIAMLAGAGGIAAVMPTYTFDAYINVENENRTVRTYALPDGINTVDLIEGRLPEGPGECAVERSLLDDGKIKIGDSLRLNLDSMADYYDVFATDTFTVVGVVTSPLYISLERGNTTLGDGSLSYYMYLSPAAYSPLGVYTDVYLLMDGSREMDNLTDGYDKAADGWQSTVEQIGALRVQAAKDKLADAQKEINDNWISYYGGVKELVEKTAEGNQKLADSKTKLADTKTELEDGQRTLDERVAEGQKEIDKQTSALKTSQDQLDANRAELNSGEAQLQDARGQLEQTLSELAQVGPQGASPILDVYYRQADAAKQQLDDKQAELDAGKTALAQAQAKLDAGAKQIDDARAALEDERAKSQDEIDQGWADYYKGLNDYDEGVKTLETETADAQAKLDDAKSGIEEAQDKLDGAPEPEWFYFTRKDGLAFDSYYQDTLRLQKISYVFPLVFFLVAIMVSLTTMSRMVEEHRTQIGIYKALGYRPAAIMSKYLIYAFSSGVIGGILGIILGSNLFPAVIVDAYSHLYDMPPVDYAIPGTIAIIAVISAVMSVLLVTLGTCMRAMAGAPALLMRPKPPAKGKRVWLERIPFIWNRFGFFSKVTARNILRYKRRFIMTLVGVAGCSALLLTAFGMRDSIGTVGALQYGSIVKYDSRAYLKDITSAGQRSGLDAALPAGHLYIREEAVTASGANGGLAAFLMIPDAPEKLNEFINLYSPETGATIPMTADSVLVTDKLARVMGVSIGDSFTMTYSGGKAYTAVVTGIVDNYIQHFIYMSPDVYKGMTGNEAPPNSVLFFDENGQTPGAASAAGGAANDTAGGAAGGSGDSASPLLQNSDVRAVIHNADLVSRIGNSTDAMGVVTVVLIVLAAALALVVLFNLTNINISERIRELATIKVLGFNDMELAMYIYRENGAVTLLGMILGVIGGIFLYRYVITTVEIDILKFPKTIHPLNYVITVALSLFFAVFVNLVMNRRLSRIDMVESLKSAE